MCIDTNEAEAHTAQMHTWHTCTNHDLYIWCVQKRKSLLPRPSLSSLGNAFSSMSVSRPEEQAHQTPVATCQGNWLSHLDWDGHRYSPLPALPPPKALSSFSPAMHLSYCGAALLVAAVTKGTREELLGDDVAPKLVLRQDDLALDRSV